MNLEKYKKVINELDEKKLSEFKKIISEYSEIIILGNGGSNAISSHIAEDYTKVLGKKVLSFSDSARLSCYANDYGWDNSYRMFIQHFYSPKKTLVILISSSGNSENIIQSAKFCFENEIPMITLSGFLPENNLKKNYESKSLLHFWVDSDDYGIVECSHELILHSIL